MSQEKMRIRGWDCGWIFSNCVVISRRMRLSDYLFLSLLGACLFKCSYMYNNNTIIIHLSCWDQHWLTMVVVLFQYRWLNWFELLIDNMIVPVIFFTKFWIQLPNLVLHIYQTEVSIWQAVTWNLGMGYI